MTFSQIRRQVILLLTKEHSARDIADILDIPLSRVSAVLYYLSYGGYIKKIRKHTVDYKKVEHRFYSYKLNSDLPFEQCLCSQCGEIKDLVDIDYKTKRCNNCNFIITYGDIIDDAAQGYSHITVEFMQNQINDLKQMLYKTTAENYKLIKLINKIYDDEENHGKHFIFSKPKRENSTVDY